MGICIATTSGKGGTGKSTISVGLAFCFAKMKKSVALVDMDAGLRCLDLMLGVDGEIVFDLSDVLSGHDISDASYQAPSNDLINVIPAPISLSRIDCAGLAAFSNKIKSMYDIVIFDFPAGIDFSLYRALDKKTQFIVVCNPDPVSVRDASAVCNNLPDTLCEPRLVINRFDSQFIKKGIYSNIDDIIDISGFRLIGIVPQSNELMLLSASHHLNHKCKAFKALNRIARRLCGEELRLPKTKKI